MISRFRYWLLDWEKRKLGDCGPTCGTIGRREISYLLPCGSATHQICPRAFNPVSRIDCNLAPVLVFPDREIRTVVTLPSIGICSQGGEAWRKTRYPQLRSRRSWHYAVLGYFAVGFFERGPLSMKRRISSAYSD